MEKIIIYRGTYTIVGAIFAFLVTQSSLTDRTQLWLLVTYIVVGIIVTELLIRKARKKQDEASIQEENVQS